MSSGKVRMQKLKKDIKACKRIVMYGAGCLAKILNAELAQSGIGVNYCVVSHKDSNVNAFEGIPLYAVDDRISDMRKEEVITLISVTEKYEKEIEEILLRNGIFRYLLISRYVRKTDSFRIYQNKSEQEYLDEIAEWYADANHLPFYDLDEIKKQLKDIIQKNSRRKDKAVFAVGNFSPRVIKMAGALHKKGFEVEILFYPGIWILDCFLDALLHVADSCKMCESIEELMYGIMVSQAEIVHLFSSIEVSYVARILIQRKKLFSKLIFDQYDIGNGMYIETNELTKEMLDDERYCLEHADGVCFRGYEQEYLLNEMNYKMEGAAINFFDYCQDDEFDESKDCDNGALTLCYAGGIATEQEWPGASYACLLEFAGICEKSKCHLHVYPSHWDEQRFSEYIDLDRKSDYFHFHKPVSYRDLRQELKQYDYGIHIIKNNFLKREKDGYYTRNKLIYAVTNHFYDYLEAGLPIIAAYPVKFAEYFEKKNVLLNWTLEEFDFEQLICRRKELKQNAIQVKKQLSVGKQIEKLIGFYNML